MIGMGDKNFISRLFISVFLIASVVALLAAPANAQQAVVSISPSTQDVSHHSAQAIIVNVSINDVNGLYGFQFDVSYNASIFTLVSPNNVTEGSFLKKDGSATFWIAPNIPVPGLVDNAASTRQAATTGASGNGTLAQIRFIFNPLFTNIPTTTQIRLQDVKLSNISSGSIPFAISDGTVNVRLCLNGEAKACGSSTGECTPGTQTCNASYQWGSCLGGIVPTNEICDNKDNDCDGQTDENAMNTGSLTRLCSAAHNGTCAAGTETCNTGSWAGCPLPQTEICWNSIDEDCNGQDSTCQGDITGDGCIDIYDLARLGSNFGKTGSLLVSDGDINQDHTIDVYDLVVIGREFGVKASGATC